MTSGTHAPTSAPSGRDPTTAIWALLAVLVVILFLTVGEGARPVVLKAVLVLTALGEALAFVSNSLRPRVFAEQNGRPYQPAFHGVMQDFGFYNLAFAALLAAAAVDPASGRVVLGVVVASYLMHALTHILRYLGFYYGGGHPIPTRPRALELRDGLQLIAPALGIVLFFPR